ncbi:Down syndrome cell adhesion molecule-like protein Dscam2 [Melipona quadrifasciata]|uniref:Down syndrome cell adhesion molecule-like protein Dscam2 n=1 Tax=Melipona quadrifasciata TaxID=166423 RepID=A0A0M8ZYA3_9HYME|nr:Down syndrome cell adhesion molecule-like protein Dscam2 [Melipona quadrifasciata]
MQNTGNVRITFRKVKGCDASYEMQGPSFVTEPPSRVEFTNVNGGRVDCIVRGNPAPTVDWLAADGGSITSIPGIRHVLGNGTIHFPGFEAEVFRQDVHWAIYKCSAVNSVGAIVSRDVTRYDPEVQCPGGFLGNNVLMRCNVPSFVRDHVTITSWLQEPSFNIYPSTMGDGKYHMLSSGELMILNITREDAERSYRCRTHHRLTQETVVSSNVGRLQLTEIRSTMHPMINEKVVYMSARLKDTIVIPCVAYGNPTPTNRWYYNRNQREEPVEDLSGHYVVRDGSLIVQGVQESDAGSYMCTSSNSEGSESMEVRLTVSAPLSVHVQPSIQTVDLGKVAHLTCSASGFPQAALYWLKDGQPLRTGARIRAVSRERISVMSVAREDRGMYQCFVRNEYEMAQGIAELRLGAQSSSGRYRYFVDCTLMSNLDLSLEGNEFLFGPKKRKKLHDLYPKIAPQLVYRFIEQTMQTGPSVSLKCSAAGNPTPQISWLLDGFPLPQNDRLLIGQYVTVYGDVISHVNISSVKSEDGGEYECIASSRAGEASHSARLNIYGEYFSYGGLPYVRPMSTVSAVAGKQFHIKCPVAGYPIESIVWEKDGVRLPTNMRQRVANGSLFIDTVQRAADQGTYTCTARNKHNFTSQRSVEVRVLDVCSFPPALVSISRKSGETLEENGSRLEINSIRGKHSKLDARFNRRLPTDAERGKQEALRIPLADRVQAPAGAGDPIKGPKRGPKVDSGQVEQSPRKAITVRQYDAFTSALSISTIAPAHNGTYTCRVANGAATVAHSALLHVNVPPRISPFYFENGVTEGMRTQLMCTTSQGDQPFNITWLMDDKPIQTGNNIQISDYPPFSSILTINNVSAKHSGNYTCQISNVAGLAEYSTSLSVAVTAPLAFARNIEDLVKIGKRPFLQQKENFISILFTSSILSEAFTCKNVPPRWTVEPIDQNAVVGHGVSIACQAEGFPIPSVTWKQSIELPRTNNGCLPPKHPGDTPGDYRELGYSGTEGVGVAGNGSLVISRVSRDHAGFYLCQASNGIGPGLSKLIRLTVHAGPQVSVKTQQESVRRGESVTLRCEAEGDAPLDLSWRARDSRVENYDVRYTIDNQKVSGRLISELRITQANHIDRGDYMCVATNAYGHARASIKLLVQEPPNFPRNLHVAEQGSRSLLLAWSSPSSEQDPAHASSPITNYIVQYKEAQALSLPFAWKDVWHEHNMQKMVAGDNTVALVSPLKPATSYHFRVLAENHLGTSAPSDILHAQTDGEIPGGPPRHVIAEPLGPQQVKVTWQPPDRSLWNGELLGYTISYANLGGNDQSVNITRVGITGNGDGSYDYRLTGLRKYTQYSVVVKAFNNKGDGPGSDPVTVQTLEDEHGTSSFRSELYGLRFDAVPSAPPQNVACAALTGQNIQVTWKPPPSDKVHGVVQGYKLLYEAASVVLEQQAGRETKISHALSTVLHGLSPYTNYTVQVLAYTRAGEGVASSPISCTTEETVPDAPERVKAVTSNEDAMVISWLPPRRPNGILTKYTVYIRVLDQGQEVKITKSSLTAQYLHHEATGLKLRESYEAWVTASTKMGQGPSTPVIKLQLSSTAAIISFGVPLVMPWRMDVNMACLAVGNPRPTVEWRRGDIKLQQKSDIGPDNTLTLRNVQRTHEGNYSCHVKNPLGSDEIAYTLQVQDLFSALRKIGRFWSLEMTRWQVFASDQITVSIEQLCTVPPTPPTLLATGTTTDAVQLQWKQGDNGGAPIKGFLLAYRREFSEWEEVMLDRKANTHLLEGLQCGTRYQFTLAAFNRIGSGSASKVESAKTNGTKPIAPTKHQLIKANQTFVTLELTSWQDGGCPLLYFVVEYRRLPGAWLLGKLPCQVQMPKLAIGRNMLRSVSRGNDPNSVAVSNNVSPQSRFSILDLESGTKYELRVTAYNNAGSTQAEYLFTTLSPTGSNRMHDEQPPETEQTSLFFDAHVLAPSVISLLAVFLAVAGVCFCLKTHAERSGRANDPNSQTQAALENKHNMEQREQYYATVRKPGQQSPCREVSALERIPEYSEDIYPYATFNLPEQENLSANPMRQAFYYERSETMLQGNQLLRYEDQHVADCSCNHMLTVY